MSEMYDNSQRTSFFKKDNALEAVLIDLNSRIENIEIPAVDLSQLGPIILIMGCPRSGSTVLLQWLASLGHFSYPSNLIARFYKNPYIGIRVQQALLEYDPLNQLRFMEVNNQFSSDLGKTMGALGASEYWYYWRTFFKFDNDSSVLTSNQLSEVEGISFIQKLSAFEKLTEKPLVLKGMILNNHISYLHNLFPKFLFINLTRDSFYNSQSLLFARERYFEDRKKWYSFKIPEYKSLMHEDPITQVAGQVIYTRKAVKSFLNKLPESNVLSASYEDLCENPNIFLEKLQTKYRALGGVTTFQDRNINKEQIVNKNRIMLSKQEEKKLRMSIDHFEAITN